MATCETGLINSKVFQEMLKEKINKAMISSAQPILDKALEDIEAEMKKTLGSFVVGFLDAHLTIDRIGTDLRILVKHQ